MASIEDKNLIIECNLRENDSDIAAALEKRAAHIGEKAFLAIQSDSEEARDVYDRIFAKTPVARSCIPQNEKYVSAVQRAIDMYDKINCVENNYTKRDGRIDEEGKSEL